MTLRLTLALTSLLFLLPACGGGDPYEEMAMESIGLQEQFVEVLSKITDVESAEKYKDDLADITAKMKSFSEKAEAMDEPSAEAQEALSKKLADKMQPIMESLGKEMTRIVSNPELSEIVGSVLPGQ